MKTVGLVFSVVIFLFGTGAAFAGTDTDAKNYDCSALERKLESKSLEKEKSEHKPVKKVNSQTVVE